MLSKRAVKYPPGSGGGAGSGARSGASSHCSHNVITHLHPAQPASVAMPSPSSSGETAISALDTTALFQQITLTDGKLLPGTFKCGTIGLTPLPIDVLP